MTIAGDHALLDHLVYAVPDLAAGVADFTMRTGINPVFGGRHPRGTANYLLALGPSSYLEIIGVDPAAELVERPRMFGLDRLTTARLVAWAVHPHNVDDAVRLARERGYDPGDVGPLSRRTPDGTLLSWRLTQHPSPAAIDLVPFLIDWGATEHPARSGLPAAHLVTLTATHPDPQAILRDLSAIDVDLDVARGAEASLVAVLDTPNGRVTLR